MKLVFILTFDTVFKHEHPFTRNVIKALIPELKKRGYSISFGVIGHGDEKRINGIEPIEGEPCFRLNVPGSYGFENKVAATKEFFEFLGPDIVHSNMTEIFDIEACRHLGIPICSTVHIGGLVCPMSGGTGFLKYDGTLCNQSVSSECEKCLEQSLPVPIVAHMFRKIFPRYIRRGLFNLLQKKNINLLYLSPLLEIDNMASTVNKKIGILKYSHLIAGCDKLVDLLRMNGISERVHLIPHGVITNQVVGNMKIGEKVRFYYVGRLDEAKGTGDLLRAFLRLDSDKAELHIIGDPGCRTKKNQRLMGKYKKIGNRHNIFFYGRVPYKDNVETTKDFHVMVHPARYLEVYGIAIAEALGTGHPVIATKCGGADMQIQDGINGWLVETNDIDALYRKMKYFVENPDQIIAMSKSCKIPHPMPQYIERLIELYTSINGK